MATRMNNGWLLVETDPPETRYKVLLLPGLQGSDVAFSRLMGLQAFADAGVKLIAGNPPGFKGQPLSENFDCSVEAYAAAVYALALDEGIDLIVGHSFGANVLIEMVREGESLGPLMMISPCLERSAETKDLRQLDGLSRNPLMRDLAWRIAYGRMASVFKPYIDDEPMLAAVVADARAMPREVGRRILVNYFDHMDRHGDLATVIAGVENPICFVRGEHDDIGFSNVQRSQLDAAPNVHMHDLPGARHYAMVDRPEAVAGFILKGLEEGAC